MEFQTQSSLLLFQLIPLLHLRHPQKEAKYILELLWWAVCLALLPKVWYHLNSTRGDDDKRAIDLNQQKIILQLKCVVAFICHTEFVVQIYVQINKRTNKEINPKSDQPVSPK